MISCKNFKCILGEYVCMAQNMIDTRRSRPAKLDVYTDGAWGSWDAWSGCPISQNKCIKGMWIPQIESARYFGLVAYLRIKNYFGI